MIKEKKLGNTFTSISSIGQGIGLYKWRDEHVDVIREGIDLGMYYLDTAESYDDGNSERIIAKAIKGKRDQVVIGTKVSPNHHCFDDVIWAAERSLRRLEIDCIDLYQLHWPNADIPIEETLSAFEQLLEQGKVKHVGVGNLMPNELVLAKSLSKHIVSTQTEYNLFDRTVETSILPFCNDTGLTLIAYSPLDQGRVANGNSKRELLNKIAKKYNATSFQIALRWLIDRGNVVAIPKSINVFHLRDNARVLELDIDSDDIEIINEKFFERVHYVLPSEIRVTQEGQGSRTTYITLEEAKKNLLGFTPSPLELAEELKEEKIIKPVRLIASQNQSSYIYDLVEGRVRYWAWVIAFGDEYSIPALIYQDWFQA